MIEDLFPKTVKNILDYDAIKAAAKKYVEEIFVQIVESFGNNMVLQYMDEEHLSEVAYHVSGDRDMTVEQLLDYISSENIYRECDFVGELLEAFPEGVEYKAFEVTGYGFPNGDIPPFNGTTRSFKKDGAPQFGQDELWEYNAEGGYGERNLLMSRFKGQFPSGELPPEWKRKPGRRASWGNDETWMTTGGFGKPATIHINVDEERSVIEENGLSSVENWLGTVSNKLPINLYIEINTEFRTTNEEPSYTLKNSFVYSEEEIFCTNDPAYEVFPEHIEPPEPPAETFPIGGSMGADYSESMTAPISERMERGGIGFTGSLRENFIPASGVVEGPVELTAYFTSQGASATSDKTMTFGTYQLYDSSGAVILSDGSHTYTFVKAYDYAGNEVTVPSSVYAPVFNNSGTLCLGMHPDSFTAYRLTYTVSNNT